MINRSAEALVELISEDDLERRATFPENHDIREISLHLALRVIQQLHINLVFQLKFQDRQGLNHPILGFYKNTIILCL